MSKTGSPHRDSSVTIPAAQAPILVATDGTATGEDAFRAAAVIAAQISAKIQVLVVVEPLPVIVPDPQIVTQPLVASPELLDAVRDRVIVQMRSLAPKDLDWDVDVEYGRPGDEICEKALDVNAQLIVIGLVHHRMVDRLLDGDTALAVVRHSHAPVLLASSEWKQPPDRALFAVDFSPQSMEAARVGLRFVGERATVILAHVRPVPIVFEDIGMWEQDYETAAVKELAKFAEALNTPPNIRIETALLRGRPAAALLALAEDKRVDLVVAGMRGMGFVQRLLVGSVATGLIRHSTRSVLIVPDVTGSVKEPG